MISTLTRLIDNEQSFLNDFIAMAKDAKDKYDLSDTIKDWFEDALEFEKVEVIAKDVPHKTHKSYSFIFQSILNAAIQNISNNEWIEMAKYYIIKAAESSR